MLQTEHTWLRSVVREKDAISKMINLYCRDKHDLKEVDNSQYLFIVLSRNICYNQCNQKKKGAVVMELKQAIELRRSIRKYKPDPVSDEHIKEILEAGRLAPSGTNIQPWRFVVVKSSEVRQEMAPYTVPFVSKAPVVIACCADATASDTVELRMSELQNAGAFEGVDFSSSDIMEKVRARLSSGTKDMIRSYLTLNTAIAIDHMTLRAVDLGLGSCWVMLFDQEKIKEVLGLGEDIFVVALLPIGYPDQNPAPRPRLELSKLVIKEM